MSEPLAAGRRATTSRALEGYHSPQLDVVGAPQHQREPVRAAAPSSSTAGSRSCAARPLQPLSRPRRARPARRARRAPRPAGRSGCSAPTAPTRCCRRCCSPTAVPAAAPRCSSPRTRCTRTSPASPAPRWSWGSGVPTSRSTPTPRARSSRSTQPDDRVRVQPQQPDRHRRAGRHHRGARSTSTATASSSSTRPTASSRRGARSSSCATTGRWWSCARTRRCGRWPRSGSASRSRRRGSSSELEKVVLPYHLAVGHADRRPARARARTTRWTTACDRLVAERERLLAALASIDGVTVFPSGANFLLFRVHGDGHARLAAARRPRRPRARLLAAGPASRAACVSPSARPTRTTRSSPRSARRSGRWRVAVTWRRARHEQHRTTKETHDRPHARGRRHGHRDRRRPASRSSTTCSSSSASTAGFDLRIEATGDLEVDLHHTVEDVGIVLGTAFKEALGDKAGVRRFADSLVPLDEALVQVALDLSGRPFLVYEVDPVVEWIGTFDPQLAEEFWRALRVRRRDHAAHPLARRARTATTSSRRRSRAWPARCATRCGSRAPACRRPRARSESAVVRAPPRRSTCGAGTASACARATSTRRRSTTTTRCGSPASSKPRVRSGSTWSTSTPPAPVSATQPRADPGDLRSVVVQGAGRRRGAQRRRRAASCSTPGVERVVIGTAAVEHPALVVEHLRTASRAASRSGSTPGATRSPSGAGSRASGADLVDLGRAVRRHRRSPR